ncbi:MAG: hypothetical protein ACD_21C00246G0004 [uncultured bacterium]|nr:MAG: hypothetical protein ACD_21C00246G0004 [uncultured bacterium]
MQVLQLILSFLKIGAFCFGGGAPMIGFFANEIAINHWDHVAAGYHSMVAIAQLIPGPFGIDASVYIGYKLLGLKGIFITTIAISLPAFLILIIISRYYAQFKQNRYIQLFLKGLRPIVIGLLFFAAYTICPITKQAGELNMLIVLKTAVLFVLGYVLLSRVKINSFGYFFLFGLVGVCLF